MKMPKPEQNSSRSMSPVQRGVTAVLVLALSVLAGTFLVRARSGTSPSADRLPGPLTASQKAVRGQMSTPPGPPPPGQPPPVTYPPGPAGCGFAAAAFCETFEGARNTTGNRNGDISAARFSLARWKSVVDTQPNHVEPAQIPACRSGAASTPLPPGDSLVCDPTSAIQSHYALVSTAEQNYGDNSYRLAQPFDIAGRTGNIRLQVSLNAQAGRPGWPTLAYTSDPYNAPSYLADNSGGPTPREGVEVQFNSVCPSPGGWTTFPKVRVYHRYQETELADENGFASGCTSAIQTQVDRLNQVQIQLSQSHLTVWMSDASSDGVHFGALRKVYSAPLSLTFSQGYVYFGVHNHATEKYANLPSWTVLWDNIGFDGPRLAPARVYQASDATTVSGSGRNIGYWLPDSATGGATPALALTSVSTAGASNARLVFDMGADELANTNWAEWRVNYRLNRGPWHAIGFSADELALITKGRSGSYMFSVPVAIGELATGTNTVQLSGTNFYNGYQPYVGNIDLVVT
jgi:hypothetical protein